MSLEPIDPETALELYLQDKQNELAEATLTSKKYRLRHFVRWCQERGIENLNTLTGRKLHEYRLWRREESDLNKVSEKTQMDSLRSFVRWLEAVDGVEPDLGEKVLSPAITADENSRDVMLESDRASTVLSYDAEEQYLKIRHRPETGTPVKNQGDGERLVALSDDVCNLLDDWLAHKRPNVTDEYGRDPLLASRHGRAGKTTLRVYVYRWTRPCVYGEECPHDRDPESCLRW
jgi:site-specific recombinase XerD